MYWHEVRVGQWCRYRRRYDIAVVVVREDPEGRGIFDIDDVENPQRMMPLAYAHQLSPIDGRELAIIQAMVALGAPLPPELIIGELTNGTGIESCPEP